MLDRNVRARPKLSGVASADRLLTVLTAFKRGDDALALTELAQRTELVKSTIMRLCVRSSVSASSNVLLTGATAWGPKLHVLARPTFRHLRSKPV